MIEDFLQREALVLECSIIPHYLSTGDLAVFERNGSTGKKTIFYNKMLPIEDARVAAAKALEYHVWHQGENYFSIRKDTLLSKKEVNGVYELLMPKQYVESFVQQLMLPTTYALASLFGVTQEFVRERLDYMEYTGLIAGYNY